MREAFSLLIDRGYFSEKTQTCNTPAASFIPPGVSDGNGGVFRTDADAGYYDPYAVNKDREDAVARARKLLEAAGYTFGEDGKLSDDTPIEIEYLTIISNDSDSIATAQYLPEDLSAVGIFLTVRKQQDPFNYNEDHRNGSFDIITNGWYADFNDPINFLEMWTTSSGNNFCHFGKAAKGDS